MKKTSTLILSALAAFCLPTATQAGDGFGPTFKIFGQADLRLATSSGARSSFDGGFGKHRFGEDASGETGYDLKRTEVAATVRGQLMPSLVLQVTGQYNPDSTHEFDLTEAFLRWRPASTTRLRFALKAGAVFPHVSFENTGHAWSNIYTLTNSAANTWIAEEFRPVGAEASLQYRGDTYDLFAMAGTFWANDRSGAALAFRGFTLNAQKVGLWGDVAISDLPPGRVGERNQPFIEADDRPGFSAGLRWRHQWLGEFSLYAADNRADTNRVSEKGRLWRTKFVNAAFGRDIGVWRIGGQVMAGETKTNPTGVETIMVGIHFLTANALVSRTVGEKLKLTLRPEYFEQKDISTAPPAPDLDESGFALTFAAVYELNKHLQLTGEWVHTDAHRFTKGVAEPNQLDENTVQLNIRARF